MKGCLNLLFVFLLFTLGLKIAFSYGIFGDIIGLILVLLGYKVIRLYRDNQKKKQQAEEKRGSDEKEEEKKIEEATIHLKEFNSMLDSMIKNGHIEKQALDEKFKLANPYGWMGDLDSYIDNYLKTTAEKEKTQRKREEDALMAKSYMQRGQSSQFKQNIHHLNKLFDLTPVEFEKWVKENIFEKEGWEVVETEVTGDGGIDLILLRNNEKSIAQCKRYRNTVGEPLIRDFYGTMMSEGVSRGYFVTTGLFSIPALKFAEDKPIEMIDRRILAQKYVVGK